MVAELSCKEAREIEKKEALKKRCIFWKCAYLFVMNNSTV